MPEASVMNRHSRLSVSILFVASLIAGFLAVSRYRPGEDVSFLRRSGALVAYTFAISLLAYLTNDSVQFWEYVLAASLSQTAYYILMSTRIETVDFRDVRVVYYSSVCAVGVWAMFLVSNISAITTAASFPVLLGGAYYLLSDLLQVLPWNHPDSSGSAS